MVNNDWKVEKELNYSFNLTLVPLTLEKSHWVKTFCRAAFIPCSQPAILKHLYLMCIKCMITAPFIDTHVLFIKVYKNACMNKSSTWGFVCSCLRWVDIVSPLGWGHFHSTFIVPFISPIYVWDAVNHVHKILGVHREICRWPLQK